MYKEAYDRNELKFKPINEHYVCTKEVWLGGNRVSEVLT